jgi:hypothetical protein
MSTSSRCFSCLSDAATVCPPRVSVRNTANHVSARCTLAQIPCITMHERDEWLYKYVMLYMPIEDKANKRDSEGLLLAHKHGAAFTRNLSTVKDEMTMRK